MNDSTAHTPPATGDRVVYARGGITHVLGKIGTVVASNGMQTLPSGLRYVSFDDATVRNPAVIDVDNLDPA